MSPDIDGDYLKLVAVLAIITLVTFSVVTHDIRAGATIAGVYVFLAFLTPGAAIVPLLGVIIVFLEALSLLANH